MSVFVNNRISVGNIRLLKGLVGDLTAAKYYVAGEGLQQS